MVKKVCTTLQSQCKSNNWENALWSESGKALTWLFTPGYLKSDTGSGSAGGGVTESPQQESSSSITCTGSPLALDLGNDGLTVSSPAARQLGPRLASPYGASTQLAFSVREKSCTQFTMNAGDSGRVGENGLAGRVSSFRGAPVRRGPRSSRLVLAGELSAVGQPLE